MLWKSLKPLAFALAALALVAAGAVACGDDDDAAGTNNQESSETEARLQRVEVLTALSVGAAAEFHAIDEELQEADEIPQTTTSTVERVNQVASSTEWPKPLADKADAFIAAMADFIAALEAEDLQESKGLATDTHVAWHDLEHDAYSWVAGEEIEEHGGEGEGGESPEASDGS